MQKRFLVIITMCLVLTGCMRDVASLVIPVDLIEDTVKTAKYKNAGECDKLCDANWWKTSSTSDLQVQLNAGVAVMGQDHSGKTPLHYAAMHGKPSDIKMLIGAGADLNAENRWEKTPLIGSVRYGRLTNSKVLINAGADVNRGFPLMESLEFGRYVGEKRETWKLLVRSGAKVNIWRSTTSSDCGITPLQQVSQHGEPADVMFLLKSGADPNWKPRRMPYFCKDYKTPLQFASRNKNLDGTKAFYDLRDASNQ